MPHQEKMVKAITKAENEIVAELKNDISFMINTDNEAISDKEISVKKINEEEITEQIKKFKRNKKFSGHIYISKERDHYNFGFGDVYGRLYIEKFPKKFFSEKRARKISTCFSCKPFDKTIACYEWYSFT